MNTSWCGKGVAMALVLSMGATLAVAQGPGGRGGPRMSPEEQAKVWTLEANGVSKDIGLSESDAAKVVEAYKKSRERHGQAMEEMMATAERGPGMFQQMQEIADTERGKLAADLEAAIGKANADKAVAVLGTYNRQWDRFVRVLSDFSLDADKQSKGLTHIADYVVGASKAQEDAMASFDLEGMRAAMQELKAALDKQMGEILSAEQLATWNEETAQRGRGGPGGGRGPGGAGGRP